MTSSALSDLDVELVLTGADVSGRDDLRELQQLVAATRDRLATAPVTPSPELDAFFRTGLLPDLEPDLDLDPVLVPLPSSRPRSGRRGLKAALGATFLSATFVGAAAAAGLLPEPVQDVVDRIVHPAPETLRPAPVPGREPAPGPRSVLVPAPVLVPEGGGEGQPDQAERDGAAGPGESLTPQGGASGPAPGAPGGVDDDVEEDPSEEDREPERDVDPPEQEDTDPHEPEEPEGPDTDPVDPEEELDPGLDGGE
ncbi:hypothetical protein [Nocardioides coralli]|uniref:hypothetical protein n=1 Tax=Nocardioides coralli TaxID=2872154 RepID=UPI001CA40AFF|nr:hypothetical protein [Nocardioides coralli]QZY28724.1 hypothetical protein K6T13_14865 [Nocardioides coralli]